jgi:deoxypyrimidine-specific 5' nucleotidase type C protein (NT5C)
VNVNGYGKPVVALDIDGTLGDYHTNFLTFADKYFHSNCGSWVELATRKDNPGLPLWEWMGISQRDYRDAKLAYRQGGWKRWMPCYPGASELTRAIRSAGAEVWLCTTRPYLRLDNVDPDTREWLRRNDIKYDALLFDPPHEEDGNKYQELRRQVGWRVASVIDDLPEMIEAAYHVGNGTIPILRDQPYNRHYQSNRRAKSCDEIWMYVKRDIDRWRISNG